MSEYSFHSLGYTAEEQLGVSDDGLTHLSVERCQGNAQAFFPVGEPRLIFPPHDGEPAQQPKRHAEGAGILTLASEGHQSVGPFPTFEQEPKIDVEPDDGHDSPSDDVGVTMELCVFVSLFGQTIEVCGGSRICHEG